MCFRINFVTVFVLNFPLHLPSEYFRRFCSFRYLAKSWNLNYALPRPCLRTCFRINNGCFRINFAVECFASEALPSFIFRHRASELTSWFCFVRSSVLIARSLSRKLSRKKNNSALQFLGKRTIARSKFSENTTKTQSKLFYFSYSLQHIPFSSQCCLV